MSDVSPLADPPDAADGEFEYRSIDPLAIASLLLALASPVAIFQPLLTVVPSIGLLTAAISLTRIGRERGGRALAIAGLTLSTFFLVLPLARYVSAQLLLRSQAVPVATEFLERLQRRHPEEAVLLQMAPDYRPPLDEGLWSYFRNDEQARQQIQEFVQEPLVRMLTALGQDAEVKFFKVNAIVSGKRFALANVHYTVTFTDEDGDRKTLVISILLERHGQPMNADLNPWRIREFTTDVNKRPPV